MRAGRWLAGAAIWLLAVVVVAGVAGFAIDSAGREVGGADAVALVSSAGPGGSPASRATRGPTPVPSTAATARDVSPSGASVPARLRTPTGGETTRGGQAPAGGRTGSSSTGSSSAGSSSAGSSSTGATAPTAPTAPTTPGTPVPGTGAGRTGTYSSRGGDLVARCVGSAVDGWGLRPADGWHARAALRPRGDLDVVFATDDGQLLEVDAACHDGSSPVFTPGVQHLRPARR